MRNHIFRLTPLGKADSEVREFLEDRLTGEEFESYKKALNRYRFTKLLQASIKVLLYASIIASVFATLGLEEVELLQRVASYIGTTFLIILYAVTNYINLIRRESYHVQREVLISKAAGGEDG